LHGCVTLLARHRKRIMGSPSSLGRWRKIFPLCIGSFCKGGHDSSQGDFTPNSMA